MGSLYHFERSTEFLLNEKYWNNGGISISKKQQKFRSFVGPTAIFVEGILISEAFYAVEEYEIKIDYEKVAKIGDRINIYYRIKDTSF